MTIEEFIKARIAEREDAARATVEIGQKYTPDGYSHEYEWARILINPNGKRQGSYTFEPGAPSPEEVLRQCTAIRATLQHVETMISPSQQIEAEGDVLYPLAAIWSDHPDYNEGWKP